MSLETECGVCRRVVGVVRAPAGRGEPVRYKVAVHATTPNVDHGRTRRARCPGTGMEPAAGGMWETSLSPEQRKARELRALRASR